MKILNEIACDLNSIGFKFNESRLFLHKVINDKMEV
jgi:hypothetical protein